MKTLLQEFKEIQLENSWNYLLESRKSLHENELADLSDDHAFEIKNLEAEIKKAINRQRYVEARIKKEVLQKKQLKTH